MGINSINIPLTPTQIAMRDEIARKLEEAQCVGAVWSLRLLQSEIKKELDKKTILTGPAIEEMIQTLKWSLEKKFRNKFGRNIK